MNNSEVKTQRPIREPDIGLMKLDSLSREDRQYIAFSAWASVLSSLVLVIELIVIALALNTLLATSSISAITYLVAGLILLTLVRILCDGVSATVSASAAERIKARTRHQLTEVIANISPLDRNRAHSGELATLLSSHIDALGPYLTRYQQAKLRALIVPLAILAATAYFSWIAALVLLVAGPLIPIFMALIGGEARAASERQLQKIGTMNGVLLDRLQGLTTLQVFDAVPRAAAAIQEEGQSIRQQTMAVLRIAFLSSAVLELFAALGVAFVAVYVGFSLLGYFNFGAYGELNLTAGLAVLMIAPEFFRPLRDFAAAYHDRAGALAASGAIAKIIDGDWLRLPRHEAGTLQFKRLVADQVSISLAGSNILQNVCFEVRAGERIALVGPSGSGKSILLAALGGLIEPASGTIRFDDGNTMPSRIAWLGQKPAFVRRSVSANLTLGRAGLTRHDLEEAAKLAAADQVIARLPKGFGELLYENGRNLSGGEGQRVAVARLALSDAALILADEPTEHLDSHTAEIVIEGLLSSATNRTLIVATHDPRLISRVDRVIDVRELRKRAPLEAAA